MMVNSVPTFYIIASCYTVYSLFKFVDYDVDILLTNSNII